MPNKTGHILSEIQFLNQPFQGLLCSLKGTLDIFLLILKLLTKRIWLFHDCNSMWAVIQLIKLVRISLSTINIHLHIIRSSWSCTALKLFVFWLGRRLHHLASLFLLTTLLWVKTLNSWGCMLLIIRDLRHVFDDFSNGSILQGRLEGFDLLDQSDTLWVCIQQFPSTIILLLDELQMLGVQAIFQLSQSLIHIAK